MAIEIIPKPKVEKISWATILLGFCIVLLIFLCISYFYLDKSSKNLSQDIEEKGRALTKTPSEEALEEELLLYEAKINSFAKLLSGHQKPLNIFNFLEQICHPNIWLSDFNLSSGPGIVTISGQAESFVALGQQLVILKEIEVLKNINLSEIAISEEGKIDFALQLTFKPQIFE